MKKLIATVLPVLLLLSSPGLTANGRKAAGVLGLGATVGGIGAAAGGHPEVGVPLALGGTALAATTLAADDDDDYYRDSRRERRLERKIDRLEEKLDRVEEDNKELKKENKRLKKQLKKHDIKPDVAEERSSKKRRVEEPEEMAYPEEGAYGKTDKAIGPEYGPEADEMPQATENGAWAEGAPEKYAEEYYPEEK